MSWTALFDRAHIVKGVPVDAEIELQCRCTHDLKELKPTKK